MPFNVTIPFHYHNFQPRNDFSHKISFEYINRTQRHDFKRLYLFELTKTKRRNGKVFFVKVKKLV